MEKVLENKWQKMDPENGSLVWTLKVAPKNEPSNIPTLPTLIPKARNRNSRAIEKRGPDPNSPIRWNKWPIFFGYTDDEDEAKHSFFPNVRVAAAAS